eukprot:360964-Chlamydomonas_euryale.AAC.4
MDTIHAQRKEGLPIPQFWADLYERVDLMIGRVSTHSGTLADSIGSIGSIGSSSSSSSNSSSSSSSSSSRSNRSNSSSSSSSRSSSSSTLHTP